MCGLIVAVAAAFPCGELGRVDALWLCAVHVQVQSKVNLKYDSWHKEVLSKFGQMLGSNMTEFHSQISKVRASLDLWGRLGFQETLIPSNTLPSPDSPARSWSSTRWTRPAPLTP